MTLPAGDYWVKPKKVYQDKSRGAKKTLCLIIEAETQEQIVQTGGEEPEYIPCDAEDIKIYLYLSEKAQDMTFARLKSLNAEGSISENTLVLHPENDGFIITCVHGEWEGKKTIKWEFSFDTDPTAWDDKEALQIEAAFQQYNEQSKAVDGIPF